MVTEKNWGGTPINNHVFNTPLSWLKCSINCLDSYLVLSDIDHKNLCFENFKTQEPLLKIYNILPRLLLLGYSMENLLKAIICHNDPCNITKILFKNNNRSHDLNYLFSFIEVNDFRKLSIKEEKTLRKLTVYIKYKSRYPCPKEANPSRYKKFGESNLFFQIVEELWNDLYMYLIKLNKKCVIFAKHKGFNEIEFLKDTKQYLNDKIKLNN